MRYHPLALAGTPIVLASLLVPFTACGPSGGGGTGGGSSGGAPSTSSGSTTSSSGSGGATTSSSSGSGGAAACAAPAWGKRFGNTQDDSGDDVAVDSAGNVAIAGLFKGTIDLGGGPLAGGGTFVAKLDASGAHSWSRRIASEVQLSGATATVAFDASGNLLLGGSAVADGSNTIQFGGGGTLPSTDHAAGEGFIAKYGPSGNFLWGKLLAYDDVDPLFPKYTHQLVQSIALDASDNVIAIHAQLASFGGAATSASKLDASGNVLWTKPFGPYGPWWTRVATDGAGNIILAGETRDTFNLGCGALPVDQTPDPVAQANIFVAKLDPSGACIWSRGFINTRSPSVAVTAAGDIYFSVQAGVAQRVAPDFGCGANGQGTGHVVKLDASGACVWDKAALTGTLALTSGGNLFGAGIIGSPPALTLFELAPSGTPVCTHACTGTTQVTTRKASFGSAHGFLTGAAAVTLDCGTGPLVSAGMLDAFLFRL